MALGLAACGDTGGSSEAGDGGIVVEDGSPPDAQIDRAATAAPVVVPADAGVDAMTDRGGPPDSPDAAGGGAGGSGGGGAGGSGGSGGTGSFDASAAADGTGAEVSGADTGGGGDAMIDAGLPANPACTAADRNGFFGSCSACRNPDNCDTISTSSGTRRACGCSSAADCPCGFRCGSYQIAPGISVSGICVR